MKYIFFVLIGLLGFVVGQEHPSFEKRSEIRNSGFGAGYSSAQSQALTCVENSGHTPDPIDTALACIQHM